MRKSPKFSPEVQERAVRMVFRRQGPVPVAMGGDRVDRRQDRLHGRDAAQVGAPGRARQRRAARCLRPAEQQRIKELEREVRELRKTNEILKLASAYFAQAELDRHHKK